MKCPDKTTKVIGEIPDVGDALAIANLFAFANEVKKVYPPGCNIVIVSDGRVFNDVYPVPDASVTRYHHLIKSLTDDETIQVVGLDEMFPGRDNEDKRDAVQTLAGLQMDSVVRKLEDDKHFRTIYVAFKRLLRKDSHIPQKKLPALGKTMMLRNECYSRLVKVLFPHHIRLSIHDHSGVEKVGIHLVGKSLMTPWHGVAVLQPDRTWCVMRRCRAEELGCTLEDALSPENEHIMLKEFASLDLSELTTYGKLPFYRLANFMPHGYRE